MFSGLETCDLWTIRDSFIFSMDWEPAESYGMDVDERSLVEAPCWPRYMTQEPCSSDSDVYMAPTAVEEVHMTSPILPSQPLNLPLPMVETDSTTFFLPPLELNMKPIVFPPLNIPAFSLQTLERRIGLSEIKPAPLHFSYDIYMPAALIHLPKPSNTKAMQQDSRPLSSISDCLPTSKARTTLQGASPILTPVTSVYTPEPLPHILEEKLWHCEISDTRTAPLDTPVKSTSSADRTVGNDIAPIDEKLFLDCVTPPGWPDWFVVQDATPSTPCPVVAEISTPRLPNRTIDEDATPVSQYSTTPQITILQEYIDSGVDLIGLYSACSDGLNSSEYDYVFRAFGGSSLEDLDWILEGFRATSVLDTYTEPYNWALVSEASLDLISFDSAYDLRHRSVETSHVLATTLSGSFELPSFKSEESNGLFQTSTPVPCDKSILREFSLAALDNMASHSTPEIVIDPCDSQSFLGYYPVLDIPNTPLRSDVQSCSPINAIYRHGNALDGFSEAAHTVERNALRNVKAFKSKLSLKVQKLRDRATAPIGFLKFLAPSSQDIRTTTTKVDIKHDVFGEIVEVTDKTATRSTKRDASTQTEELPDVVYALRPPRRPYARYSPYRKLDRDLTFDSSESVGLEYAQLIWEESRCTVTSGTPCRPSAVDDVILGSDLVVCVNSGESEEKEVTCPGAYPIEEVVYSSAESCTVSYGQGSECELETGLVVRVNLGEPEEDYQEKELTFPGTYPIDALDEPAKRKQDFEAKVSPCSAQYGFRESFCRLFAHLL